jgi:hypothetical protein
MLSRPGLPDCGQRTTDRESGRSMPHSTVVDSAPRPRSFRQRHGVQQVPMRNTENRLRRVELMALTAVAVVLLVLFVISRFR